MSFNFLKNKKGAFDSGSKNNKSNISSSNKTVTRKNGHKRHSYRNGMSGGSYSNPLNSSKPNACLLILIIYIIFGYMFYQLLK
jgi:hypothetical protein